MCNHGNQGGGMVSQPPLDVIECPFVHLDGEQDTHQPHEALQGKE